MNHMKTFEEFKWPWKKLTPEEEYEKQKKQAQKDRAKMKKDMGGNQQNVMNNPNINNPNYVRMVNDVENAVGRTKNPGVKKSRSRSK
jgi:hypothetical protein